MSVFIHIFVVILVHCLVQITTGKQPYEDAATDLRNAFVKFFNDQLGVNYMQDTLDKESFTISKLDGMTQIKQISEKLKSFFSNVFDSVKKLQNEIKKLYKDKGFDGQVIQCCDIDNTKLEYNREFFTEIENRLCYRTADGNYNVLIPASNSLLKIMQSNWDIFPKLKWQYYGTEEGAFIVYPGHGINSCTSYDPRFRPWYVEVLTPVPKDIVIVFDRSKSMDKNKKLELSKLAAQTVVETLNPNDRMALVLFSSDASTPPGTSEESCYSYQMAFATPGVKQYFIRYLQEDVVARGDTDYKKALEKAFTILKTVTTDPNRRKAILFLTDGKPSQGSDQGILDLLSKLNAKQNNRVLILTYGLGHDLQDGQKLLQDMANMTVYNKSAGDRIKGHFEHITDTETVRNKLGSYYNYFSGVDTLKTPIVTIPYTDFSGLGHIFSVCLPVKNQTQHLKGTTCVDMQLEAIKETYGFIEDDETYVFIIDRTGRTLVHPLLPSPGIDARADPLFVNITVLEPDAAKQGIIADMMRLIRIPVDSGPYNRTIEKTMVLNRGNASLDGVNTVLKTTQYLWQKIPQTDFAVCLVMTENIDKIVLNVVKYAEDPHYHLVNVSGTVDKNLLCEHNGESFIKEFPTIQFSKKAYTDDKPLTEDKVYIQQMINYLKGATEENAFNFKKDIRSSIALVERLAPIWKNSFHPYIYKKYIGTHEGIYQVYPGEQLQSNFDVTKTDWFIKAKVNSPYIAISRYTNGITFNRALLKSKSKTHTADDMLWAVIGMVISDKSLNGIVNNVVHSCSMGSYKCMLMDNNGYLVYHSKPNTNFFPIPLESEESEISDSLIRKRILQPNTCTDYAWKQQYHTWKVTENPVPVDNLKGYPPYFFSPIDDTNLFFIFVPANVTSYKNCYSCSSGQFIQKKCYSIDVKCYCPCYTPANYQYCLNIFENSESSTHVPCLKMQDIISSNSQLSAKNLPQCFPYTCSEISNTTSCNYYSGCSWCHNQTSTDMRCRNTKECFFGEIINPGTMKNNLVIILVPLFVLLLLAIAIIVLMVVLHRKGVVPCYKCVRQPSVKADDLYTDVPSVNNNTTRFSREPREHQEGPYSISGPIGFMNGGYSGRHSILTGSSGSIPSADVRYVKRDNGRVNSQPVLIIPVDVNRSLNIENMSQDTPYMSMNANGILATTGHGVSLTANDRVNLQNYTGYGQSVYHSSISSQSNSDGYYEPVGPQEQYLQPQANLSFQSTNSRSILKDEEVPHTRSINSPPIKGLSPLQSAPDNIAHTSINSQPGEHPYSVQPIENGISHSIATNSEKRPHSFQPRHSSVGHSININSQPGERPHSLQPSHRFVPHSENPNSQPQEQPYSFQPIHNGVPHFGSIISQSGETPNTLKQTHENIPHLRSANSNLSQPLEGPPPLRTTQSHNSQIQQGPPLTNIASNRVMQKGWPIAENRTAHYSDYNPHFNGISVTASSPNSTNQRNIPSHYITPGIKIDNTLSQSNYV